MTITNLNMAWATYAQNESQVPAARLLLRSLKSVFTSKKTVLLIPQKNNISKNVMETLSNEFERVYFVPDRNGEFTNNCKVHSFSLLEFGKVALLPPTSMVLENCDQFLENWEDFSILKPDFRLYQKYLENAYYGSMGSIENSFPVVKLDDENMEWSLEQW